MASVMLMHSVTRCLSICLSHSGIMWKWLNMSLKFFYPRFIVVFSAVNCIPIWSATDGLEYRCSIVVCKCQCFFAIHDWWFIHWCMRCLPDSPKPDSPKPDSLNLGLGLRVRVRVGVSAKRVSAKRVSANRVLVNRDWTYEPIHFFL